MERLPFKAAGAWLTCGARQVHLIVHPPGSFRTGNIDNDGCHLAFRIDDFDGALAMLTANGFREDAAEDDPMHVIVRRNGPAGFPQLFILDPDRNINRDQRRAIALCASPQSKRAPRRASISSQPIISPSSSSHRLEGSLPALFVTKT